MDARRQQSLVVLQFLLKCRAQKDEIRNIRKYGKNQITTRSFFFVLVCFFFRCTENIVLCNSKRFISYKALCFLIVFPGFFRSAVRKLKICVVYTRHRG